MSILNQLQSMGVCTDALAQAMEDGVALASMQPHEARRVIADQTGTKLVGLPSVQIWSDLLDVVFPALDENPSLVAAFLALAPEGVDELLLATLREMQPPEFSAFAPLY